MYRCSINDVPSARDALTQHRPTPDTEEQARLWAQLHLGLDLTDEDAEIAVGLAERFFDVPALAEGITSLLRRVQHRRQRDGVSPWPEPLSDRVAALSATVFAGADPEAIAESTVDQLLGKLEEAGHLRVARRPGTGLYSKPRWP